MNEASNFCTGPCYANQTAASPIKKKLPYTPTGRDLETKSMPLDAYHAQIAQTSDDGQTNVTVEVTEFDAHSLFGTMQVKTSHEWFQ